LTSRARLYVGTDWMLDRYDREVKANKTKLRAGAARFTFL
jgi:hypothetical protein